MRVASFACPVCSEAGTLPQNMRCRPINEGPTMNPQHNTLGLLIGALVVALAFVFIETGGDLGGKKTVNSDADLPPVAMGAVDR
jgi:hypothetical protein